MALQDPRLLQTRHQANEPGQGEILQVAAVVHFVKENNVETWSITNEVPDVIMTIWLETLQQQVDVGLLHPLFALYLCNCRHFLVLMFPQNHNQISRLQLAELVVEMGLLWTFFRAPGGEVFHNIIHNAPEKPARASKK